MKHSDSTTPQAAQWPPDKMQILMGMRAAQMAGTFSQEDADQMDQGPPETWPPELMAKLGFSPPEDSAEAAWAELKAEGYPKQDSDLSTGETFPTYPEEIFYNDEHPLSGALPDNARPETWRDLDSAAYNPSKARSIQ